MQYISVFIRATHPHTPIHTKQVHKGCQTISAFNVNDNFYLCKQHPVVKEERVVVALLAQVEDEEGVGMPRSEEALYLYTW